MFRRRPAASDGRRSAGSNEELQTVPVYGVDPHGGAMFAGINNGNAVGGRPVIDARGGAWHGWTAPPQRMAGAANVGNLGGRPIIGPGPTLDQERGLAPDPIQSIFEQRMTSRRFS